MLLCTQNDCETKHDAIFIMSRSLLDFHMKLDRKPLAIESKNDVHLHEIPLCQMTNEAIVKPCPMQNLREYDESSYGIKRRITDTLTPPKRCERLSMKSD